MITNEDIAKVAQLSKLKIFDHEMANLTKQITEVMAMIDDLNDVVCPNEMTSSNILENNQRLREDEVTSTDLSLELLANVQGSSAELAKEIRCFVVPKVIE